VPYCSLSVTRSSLDDVLPREDSAHSPDQVPAEGWILIPFQVVCHSTEGTETKSLRFGQRADPEIGFRDAKKA